MAPCFRLNLALLFVLFPTRGSTRFRVSSLNERAQQSLLYRAGSQSRRAGIRQISASKPPGYAEMALRKMHRRHFPTATVETFTVLMIAPTERRRDALRKGIHGKPGSELWKFVSQTDLAPESFLYGSIFFPCQGDPRPLVKKVEQATPTTTQSS